MAEDPDEDRAETSDVWMLSAVAAANGIHREQGHSAADGAYDLHVLMCCMSSQASKTVIQQRLQGLADDLPVKGTARTTFGTRDL